MNDKIHLELRHHQSVERAHLSHLESASKLRCCWGERSSVDENLGKRLDYQKEHWTSNNDFQRNEIEFSVSIRHECKIPLVSNFLPRGWHATHAVLADQGFRKHTYSIASIKQVTFLLSELAGVQVKYHYESTLSNSPACVITIGR